MTLHTSAEIRSCEGCGGSVGAAASQGSGFCRPCYKKQFSALRREIPKKDRLVSCDGCGERITVRKSGKCRACYQAEFFSDPENRVAATARSKAWSQANREKVAAHQRRRLADPVKRYPARAAGAAKRGHTWNISLEQYLAAITSGCEYCGTLSGNIGIDRKDSAVGYEPTNVVGCCWPCNKVKSDVLTYDEMVVAMSAIIKLRQKGGAL